ncbi:AbrB/MazE/SpoVT family DNA-binding domain-containing protein [Patescibacteria group bacterium]|nr:AbrB/MazE/SpoVT family DNA-binding domain-containing protein [Patescibacteria group bacterium]MBU4057304.1 AbrB/MazE/SpoVT family DNA-binding domain-containing protein [Patescibacteria group bacterium]
MVSIVNQAKKWGNSLGVVIPAEIVRKIKLKEGQTLEIKIRLKKRIDAFGRFRGARKFKEEALTHRKFW